MGVKERLNEYIKSQGLSVLAFEKMCGLSNGYVSSISKGIGKEKLENILRIFPNLNREWLLYGEGEMLNDTKPSESPVGIPLIPQDAMAGALGGSDSQWSYVHSINYQFSSSNSFCCITRMVSRSVPRRDSQCLRCF